MGSVTVKKTVFNIAGVLFAIVATIAAVLGLCEFKVERFDRNAPYLECEVLREVDLGYMGRHAFCLGATFYLGGIPYTLTIKTGGADADQPEAMR